MTAPADTYTSATGEQIPLTDWARWIDRGRAAIAVVRQDFGRPDDEEPITLLSDLLCHLMHTADADGIDFAEALRLAGNNHDAERKGGE